MPTAAPPCSSVPSASTTRPCDGVPRCQKRHKWPAGSQPFLLGSPTNPCVMEREWGLAAKWHLLCSLSRKQSWEVLLHLKSTKTTAPCYTSLLHPVILIYMQKNPWDFKRPNSPGVRAAGSFLRCCRCGWFTQKNTQTFMPVLWHTKSSSVHLRVFFCSFSALTLILLMIKHLKHFKTKLSTFRYFFPVYEKDRFFAGIYLSPCSLAPWPKIYWNTLLFISELWACQATQFFFI